MDAPARAGTVSFFKTPLGRSQTGGRLRCWVVAACIGLAVSMGLGLPGARAASAAGSSANTACSDETTESLIRELDEIRALAEGWFAEPRLEDPEIRPSPRRLVLLTCLIEKNPLDWRWYAQRGEEYMRQENYRAAIQDYTAEIGLARTGYESRAWAYEYIQQYDAAVRDYQEAIRRAPNDDYAFGALAGMCSLRAKAYSLLETIDACNLVLAIRPRSDQSRLWLAVAYFKAGQFVEAARYFDQSLTYAQDAGDEEPNRGAHALYGRGLTRLRLGDSVRGRADIEQARRMFPPVVVEMAEYGVVESPQTTGVEQPDESHGPFGDAVRFLRFPLDCANADDPCDQPYANGPYTPGMINAILDHSMRENPKTGNLPYGLPLGDGRDVITAFNGEQATGSIFDTNCLRGRIELKSAPGADPMTNASGCRNDPNFAAYDDHPGYDYRAALGTPVKAAANGHVLSLDGSRCYIGNMGDSCDDWGFVGIDHGNGYVSQYGHLSRIVVNAGDSVTQGQVIGYSGSTSPPEKTVGPHLHFEVWAIVGGTYLLADPYGWTGTGQDPLYRAPGSPPVSLWEASSVPPASEAAPANTVASAQSQSVPELNPQSSAALPAEIRSFLDRRHPGWRLYDLDIDNPGERQYCDPGPEWGSLVRGDFDGDGQTDYAVLVVGRTARTDGVDGYEGSSLAFISRPHGYQSFDIMGGSFLSVARRGSVTYEILDNNGDRLEIPRAIKLQNDGLIMLGCEAYQVTLLFQEGRFVETHQSD